MLRLRKRGMVKKLVYNIILQGDCLESLKTLPDKSANLCVTSPPYYGLRNYGNDSQIGLEDTPDIYIRKLTEVFHEIKRILVDDGLLFVNIGDTYNTKSYKKSPLSVGSKKQASNRGSYENVVSRIMWNGCKAKDLIGIPWMLAFALRSDGWYLRQDIIWSKLNPMPESIQDRFTKSHEYIFMLSKKERYYFNHDAIQEIGVDGGKRNKRDVWSVNSSQFKQAHFATFPEHLIEPCILAGCPKDGIVIDPFMGAGTVGVVAKKNHRKYIGCELNKDYIKMAKSRISNTSVRLF